jgi:tRNA nucleotidyltransferase/poly(A) polymerase
MAITRETGVGVPSPQCVISPQQCEALRRIDSISKERGVLTYLVGGFVRDMLRQVSCEDRDLDILVEGNALDFADSVANTVGGSIKKHPAFLTAKLIQPARLCGVDEIDFASARSEQYSRSGALPVVQQSSVNLDLKRRDFTVNAIALPLSVFVVAELEISIVRSVVVDPHGGVADLDAKVLRTLHPASFYDDPTRLFRGARYLARLNVELEADTRLQAEQACHQGVVHSISARRRINELIKILLEPLRIDVIGHLDRLGVCKDLFADVGLQERDTLRVLRLLSVDEAWANDEFRGSERCEESLLIILLAHEKQEQREKFLSLLSIERSRKNRILRDCLACETTGDAPELKPLIRWLRDRR